MYSAPFMEWDILWACLHEDTGATTFSHDPNTQGSKKEPRKHEAAAIASNMKGGSAPTDAKARGQHSCLESDAQELYRCSVGSVPDYEQLLSSTFSLHHCWAGRTARTWLLQAAIATSILSCSYSDSSP